MTDKIWMLISMALSVALGQLRVFIKAYSDDSNAFPYQVVCHLYESRPGKQK